MEKTPNLQKLNSKILLRLVKNIKWKEIHLHWIKYVKLPNESKAVLNSDNKTIYDQ